MDSQIKKIMLFTLSACPLGRSMGTVLREVIRIFEKIELETVFIDVQTEMTNFYRVKKNPTTIFIDDSGNEKYRVQEFLETEHVINLLEQINQGESERREIEENRESEERYTIYLFQNEEIVPIKVIYTNLTSVRAPRITAIKLLLAAQYDGFMNPFPASAELDLVLFKDKHGEIIIDMSEVDCCRAEREKMKRLLVKTLSHFGIEEVDITITNYNK